MTVALMILGTIVVLAYATSHMGPNHHHRPRPIPVERPVQRRGTR